MIVGNNLYMYGHFTASLREDFPTQPYTKKGKVRAAMAQETLDAHNAGKVRPPSDAPPISLALTIAP